MERGTIMQLNLQKTFLLLALILTITLCTNSALAQDDTTPKKRLRSPATMKGLIGGESHDSYVIRARRGQVMTVQISWRREGDNRAEFTVSEAANFFGANQAEFGKASNNDKRWTGKVPKTRDYYLYVVAHPTAHYTLRVTTK
jgi:hypothetical protein